MSGVASLISGDYAQCNVHLHTAIGTAASINSSYDEVCARFTLALLHWMVDNIDDALKEITAARALGLCCRSGSVLVFSATHRLHRGRVRASD